MNNTKEEVVWIDCSDNNENLSPLEKAIKNAEDSGYTISKKLIHLITLVEYGESIRLRILGNMFNLKEVAKVDGLAEIIENALANYKAALTSKAEKLEYADKLLNTAIDNGNESMIVLLMKIIDEANIAVANSRLIEVNANVVFATRRYQEGDPVIDGDGYYTNQYYDHNGTCVHIVG